VFEDRTGEVFLNPATFSHGGFAFGHGRHQTGVCPSIVVGWQTAEAALFGLAAIPA
jgi:hypothetical protein